MKKATSARMLKDEILSCLYRSPFIEKAVDEVLAMTGEYFDVSRVYVFENSEDDQFCSNTFEWCNVGISPEKDNLQNMSYAEDLGGTYQDNFNEEGVFFCSDIRSLPREQFEILEPQGVKALLQSAIMDRGVFKGCIGFDECSNDHVDWEEDSEKVETLAYIARLLSIALLERRNLMRLTESAEQLKIAYEKARKADKAKSDFLSRISHDMRTPLNGIFGLTKLMREKRDWADIQADLDQLELSGRYLLDLINDTLDVNRIESGQMELHPTVCDAAALFDNVNDLLQPNVQEKRLRFSADTSGLPARKLFIDVGRVEQLFMNIIGNAVKFTPPEGAIDLIVHDDGIVDDAQIVRVIVRDTGIGMSKEFLPHLFEPFSQEDSSSKSIHVGTGLGMSISRKIVDLMGGSLSVESELGVGTAFTVVLPLPFATKDQITQSALLDGDGASLALPAACRVLLCEDHPLNAQIAMRLLDSRGIEVVHAENGFEGLKAFENAPCGYYDAVLMDVRMPVMNGLEAIEAIRAFESPSARRVPIIALTANAFAEDVECSLSAGADAHLAKPVEPALLLGTLSRLMAD